MTNIKHIIPSGALAIGAIIACASCSMPDKSIEVSQGQIKDIKTMVELCTVEIYSEVPVKDTINNKMLIGIQKQMGSVSFDLEALQSDTDGDTIRIVLPPEIVEIHESTDNNSWQVIDTKGLSLFTSDKLTNEEENQIKAKIKKNSIKLLYKDGTIERARAEGTEYLKSLMEKLYDKPVEVTDPTPRGAHYNEYRR